MTIGGIEMRETYRLLFPRLLFLLLHDVCAPLYLREVFLVYDRGPCATLLRLSHVLPRMQSVLIPRHAFLRTRTGQARRNARGRWDTIGGYREDKSRDGRQVGLQYYGVQRYF